LHADAEVGPQRAVLGLVAHIERQRRTDAVIDVVGVDPVVARLRDLAQRAVVDATASVGLGLNTNIAAQLQAGVGARDVVEAVSVERADLHELNWLCLHRHVSCLRPSDRNQPRDATD
jgi:hypothetical protein